MKRFLQDGTEKFPKVKAPFGEFCHYRLINEIITGSVHYLPPEPELEIPYAVGLCGLSKAHEVELPDAHVVPKFHRTPGQPNGWEDFVWPEFLIKPRNIPFVEGAVRGIGADYSANHPTVNPGEPNLPMKLTGPGKLVEPEEEIVTWQGFSGFHVVGVPQDFVKGPQISL